MKIFIQILLDRIASETPQWFKYISYLAAIITIICAAVLGADVVEFIHLSPAQTDWINRIGASATAVFFTAITAKKDKNITNQNPQ
jgi:hypothetical protein